MILAIDFDGTLVDHRFPAVGPAIPGAFDWLKRFQELGACLILLTMRSDGRDDGSNPLRDAVEFCRVQGIEFWAVNDNPEQATWTSSRKVYAHAYIDDAAVGCPLREFAAFKSPAVDWDVVGPAVEKMLLERSAIRKQV